MRKIIFENSIFLKMEEGNYTKHVEKLKFDIQLIKSESFMRNVEDIY